MTLDFEANLRLASGFSGVFAELAHTPARGQTFSLEGRCAPGRQNEARQ